MHIKIQGGTARACDPPLCHTCRRATIARGPRLRDEIVECSVLETRITFPVTFCTNYIDRQNAGLHEMEEIAWILRTDPKRNRIGFVEARKVPWRERFVLDED